MSDVIAPVLVLPPGVSEADWLAARRQGVGASEVGAVVGVSPYEGPLRVWLRKVTGAETEDNPAMKWGRRLEDDVLEEFVENHPELRVDAKPGLFAAGDAPWRLVTPDALAYDPVAEPAVVEVKTGMSYGDAEQWGEPGTDEIPLQYLCQVTWACDILGYPRWHLAVLLLDRRDYREYTGEFSAELAAKLRQQVDAFWHTNVVGGVEPVADGLPDTTDILVSRATAGRDVPCDLPVEARMWLTSYRVNHEALDEREQAKREAGNLLRQYLVANDASVGYLDGERVVTFQPAKSGTPSLRVIGVSW